MQTWLQKVKNRYHWTNKIKVSKEATFVCEGDLSKTHIHVDANNTVRIGQQTTLKKVELKVVGENNRLIIGDACYIENDVPAKAAAFED